MAAPLLPQDVTEHQQLATMDQAREMVAGVGRLLVCTTPTGPQRASSLKNPPQQVRGKYKSVRTSSEEFIGRKADELRLERVRTVIDVSAVIAFLPDEPGADVVEKIR
jgi:hypothetical protein